MKNTENHTQPAPQNPGPFVNGGPHSVLYISRNLAFLRQFHRYSQEDVAEKIGVSRQAVAKWENGESIPDILNCDALARLYFCGQSDPLQSENGKISHSSLR